MRSGVAKKVPAVLSSLALNGCARRAEAAPPSPSPPRCGREHGGLSCPRFAASVSGLWRLARAHCKGSLDGPVWKGGTTSHHVPSRIVVEMVMGVLLRPVV